MKKIILAAAFLIALSGVAAAAPLMDFDKGKVAIDYTFRPSLDFSVTGRASGYLGTLPYLGAINSPFNESISRDFSGDANLDLGLTFGLGNRWGLQYRQYNPAGTIWSYRNANPSDPSEYIAVNLDGKIRSEEFNLIYGINKNWADRKSVV